MRKLITAICLFIAANSMLCRVVGVTSVFALAVAEDSKAQYNLRSPYTSTFDSSIIVNGYIIMMNPTALAGSVPSYIVVLDSATKSLKYIPTTLMMTAARAQSSIDSITASINLRRLISDSSAWHEQLINKYPLSGNPSGFISSYTETDPNSFHITDTATAFGRYARLQRVLDSLAAVQLRLNTYQVSGSYATTAQLGLKVNISDTSAMLSPYGLKTFNASTYATITNLALKNNISDTASMLSNYAKTSAVNLKLNITDTTGFRTYSNFLYTTATSTTAFTNKSGNISQWTNNSGYLTSTTGATGTYGITTVANGLVTSGKRQETYSGITNGSGVYTVTFGTAYSAAPNIQASITSQASTNQYLRISAISTTGFTVNSYAFNTNTLLGIVNLVAGTSAITSIAVDVLITEK